MNKYQVTVGFRGTRTQECYIEPGEYFENDPRLFGMGAYLVSRNKATLLGDYNQPDTPEEFLAENSDLSEAIQAEVDAYEEVEVEAEVEKKAGRKPKEKA